MEALLSSEPVKHRWSPYADNGGSIIAIGGPGYAVIACDSRLSTGYNIYTRNQSKLFAINDSVVLGCSGCWCDVLGLTRLLDARVKFYKHDHQKDMSVGAIAQMISTMLYGKRFFPYYVSNVLAGLDENGHGVVYHYDPVGHCDKSTFHAGGSSGALMQPVLDNQVALKNQQIKREGPLVMEKAVELITDAFISAAERDIYTGDSIIMKCITKNGTVEKICTLRSD